MRSSLSGGFHGLIPLIRSIEVLEELAANFNRTWKNVLAAVNSTVIHAFPNFQNGSRVLQALFTRLVVYYQSFVELWQRRFGAARPNVEPVAVQAVLLELKVRGKPSRISRL